jgi:hypothetical protein
MYNIFRPFRQRLYETTKQAFILPKSQIMVIRISNISYNMKVINQNKQRTHDIQSQSKIQEDIYFIGNLLRQRTGWNVNSFSNI